VTPGQGYRDPVPPDTRSLTRHGQDRKADLLRHAEQLFAERGYEDTRMIDIAAAAGVAKGLVYWYFDNKDTLFDEIVVDIGRRLRRAQSSALRGIDDPLERLYVGTAESVRFIAGNYRLYGIIAVQTQGDRSLAETRTRSQWVHHEDAAALIAEGQARGVMRNDDDPLALALANFGVVYQFVLMHAGRRDDDERPAVGIDEAAHGAARYVVRAVGVDADAVARVLERRSPDVSVA
jgi:AcrR family transcriptional regulator